MYLRTSFPAEFIVESTHGNGDGAHACLAIDTVNPSFPVADEVKNLHQSLRIFPRIFEVCLPLTEAQSDHVGRWPTVGGGLDNTWGHFRCCVKL